MENRKVTRDMVLKGEGLGYFTNTISLEAKSSEAKEFETTFVVSKDVNFHYKEIREYIKDNHINVVNKKDFEWL